MRPSVPCQLFAEGIGGWQRVIAQKRDNPRQTVQVRRSAVSFPPVDRGFVGPDQGSGLGLEQTKVEPSLADMVTERNELASIGF